MLLRTTTRRPAQDVPTLQEPPPDKSLSVRNDNRRTAELHLAPKAVIDRLPSIDPEMLPSLKTTKVAQSRLDSSPMLQRDSHLQKEVIRNLLRFADVILIRDYGKTNLISPASTVDPGTTPFPLAPVLKKNSREVRWAIDYRRMNAIPKEDVSSPDCRHVPQDKGWLIRDLGTDDHGSLLFGCFLFFPSLGGHGYRPRNISGRWSEATPQGEKFK